MTKKRAYHVLPSPTGGWTVKQEGTLHSTSSFDRKADAIEHARGLARNSNSNLITHGRDGRIQDSDNYGSDPYPPMDKKHGTVANPKGYGSLSGKFSIREDINISKPIYEQAEKSAKKAHRSRDR